MAAGDKTMGRRLDCEHAQRLHTLYKENYQDLVNYARVLVGPSHPEDLVHDTFLLALAKIDVVESRDNPVGWLIRTMQNLAKHEIRERRVLSFTDGPRSEYGREDPTAPSFESAIDFHVSCQKYLDAEDWELLYQYYCCGQTSEALATGLGISGSACRMRVLRAKRTLAEKLRQHEGP